MKVTSLSMGSSASLAGVFLLAGIALASCMADETAGHLGVARDTAGSGTVFVANGPEGRWTEQTAWQLDEDLRVGALADDGVAEEQFGSIASVVSDSRGRIYVLDSQEQSIRVFGPDGTYSHAIGRRGKGPGEFEGAWEVEVGNGDTLTVLDDGNMRYSLFVPDGSFIESQPRDIVGYGSPLRARLADGRYLDWGIAAPDGRSGPRLVYYPVRYNPELVTADTFPPIRHTREMVEGGGIPLMDWGSSIVASVDRQGIIWFAHSSEYRIYRRELDGDTTLVFSLAADPAPLREEDRARIRRRWMNRPDIGSQQLEALPEVKPIVYGILPDSRGQVFVFPDVAGEPAGRIVDVFRETGEYLGRMKVPSAVRLNSNRPPVMHVSQGHLYLVVRDEFDVPYVSRLRIVKQH